MMRASCLSLALFAAPLVAEETAAKPLPPDLSLETVVVTADAVKVTVVNNGGPAYGCYLQLALYDKETWNQVETRRQVVRPLGAGERQQFVFAAEAAFAGKRFQLEVDSSHRVAEQDEKNNASEKLDAPAPKAPPIRIPGKVASPGDRPPPIRIPGKAAPTQEKPPPIRIPGKAVGDPPPAKVPAKEAPPKDQSQPEIDLAAVSINDNGKESVAIVRNESGVEFTGARTARLIREVKGGVHTVERKTYGEAQVPQLLPGQTWEMTAKSLPNTKADGFVFRLVLDPRDDNPDNDHVEKTRKVVKID